MKTRHLKIICGMALATMLALATHNSVLAVRARTAGKRTAAARRRLGYQRHSSVV